MPNSTTVLNITGFASTMFSLLDEYGFIDRYPEAFKVIAGGCVADRVLEHLGVIEKMRSADIDVFIPQQEKDVMTTSEKWGTEFVPLDYLGPGCNDRTIPFKTSVRDGKINWLELETCEDQYGDFSVICGPACIDIPDLLESFDLNVCQAVWAGGDKVYVTQAFLDIAKHRTVTRNPIVNLDKRIALRIAKKARKYGLAVS